MYRNIENAINPEELKPEQKIFWWNSKWLTAYSGTILKIRPYRKLANILYMKDGQDMYVRSFLLFNSEKEAYEYGLYDIDKTLKDLENEKARLNKVKVEIARKIK